MIRNKYCINRYFFPFPSRDIYIYTVRYTRFLNTSRASKTIMGGGGERKEGKRNKIPSSSIESPSRERLRVLRGTIRNEWFRIVSFSSLPGQFLGYTTQHGQQRLTSNGPPPNIYESSAYERGDRYCPACGIR